MSDIPYPTFQHYGTAAERAAFTPDPPATGQPIYLWYETDTGLVYLYDTSWHSVSSGGAVTTIQPQGRLTLTTATPYLVSTVTAATTIYYTPAVGNLVPLYNGSAFTPTVFAELSQATTDNTKSPAAVANNSNYDLFVWNDAGTMRCTRGPAWTSDTGRGTGAGTTQLTRTTGVLLNTVDITNGPAALRGTYVGSVRSNGSAQIDMIFGGAGGAGGEGTILGLWNVSNRVTVGLANFDNTNSWPYTTGSFRLKNAGASTELNKIKFLVGVAGDGYQAFNATMVSNTGAGVVLMTGIGLDSTTAAATGSSVGRINTSGAGAAATLNASYTAMHTLGFHYLAPLELSGASGTSTWYGDDGGTQNVSAFQMFTSF